MVGVGSGVGSGTGEAGQQLVAEQADCGAVTRNRNVYQGHVRKLAERVGKHGRRRGAGLCTRQCAEMHLLVLWSPVQCNLCGGVLQGTHAIEQGVVGGVVRRTRAVDNGDKRVLVARVLSRPAQDVEVWLACHQLDAGRDAGKLNTCVECNVWVSRGVEETAVELHPRRRGGGMAVLKRLGARVNPCTILKPRCGGEGIKVGQNMLIKFYVTQRCHRSGQVATDDERQGMRGALSQDQ